MPNPKPYQTSLEDAVRALRDIAGLDPERPAKNDPSKVALRSLERIGADVGTDLTFEGHTPRPGERMFPDSGITIHLNGPATTDVRPGFTYGRSRI